jgi:hypothetical protein
LRAPLSFYYVDDEDPMWCDPAPRHPGGSDGRRGTGARPSFASLAQGRRSAFLISMPLLGPLPRHVLLPLVRLLVAVWPLAKLLKLSSGLGVANGLEGLFEGFTGSLGSGPRLAR